MLRLRSFFTFLGLVFALCITRADAQTALSRSDGNPCHEISFSKGIVAESLDNAIALEDLGFLQLGCGIATEKLRTARASAAACDLEIAAGDSFANAAALRLSGGPVVSGEHQTSEQLRESNAVEEWSHAIAAYFRATSSCGYGSDKTSLAAQKERNAIERRLEGVYRMVR